MKKPLIFIALIFICSTAFATTKVMRFPSGTPVDACIPSDSNSNCGGGGGSQTPWTGNINGAGFTLSNTGNVGIGTTSTSKLLSVGSDAISVHPTTTFTVCSSNARGKDSCDYQATGTDDQTQINAAITAANALTYGGKVNLVGGSFTIGNNGTSVIPLSNVELDGDSMYTTTLVGNRGLGNNAVVLNITSTVNNFKISNLKIDGSDVKNNVTWNVQQKGISITRGDTATDDNIVIDHVWVYNTAATAVGIDGATHVLFTHNLMDTCGTTGKGNGSNGYPLGNNGFGYGTGSQTGTKYVTIADNICKSIADACILIEEQSTATTASSGFIISNNIDTGSYNTVRISGNSGVTITGNQSYSPTDSCYVTTTNTFANVAYSNINISDNFCNTPGNNGIVVATVPTYLAAYINISNNLIKTPTNYGMNLYSTLTSVTNNTISNAGLDGIYWLSGQNLIDLNISGNKIISSGTASTATHQSALNIKINNTFSMTNVHINDNLFLGSTGYGLTDQLSAGTFANVELKNNDFVTNTLGSINATILAVGTTLFTTGNHGYTTNYIEGTTQFQNGLSGNVGIGSTAPGTTLDITGTLRASGHATLEGVTSTGATGTGKFVFDTAPAFSSTVTTSGNVGIGSSSPAAALDVVGAGAFTTQITVPQIFNADHAIAASGNAATVTRAYRNNTVTNNSAATLTITMSTTSAAAGDWIVVKILDASAVAQTIAWVNTENSTVTAPTTSNGSTTLFLSVLFTWNSGTSKWRCVAVA